MIINNLFCSTSIFGHKTQLDQRVSFETQFDKVNKKIHLGIIFQAKFVDIIKCVSILINSQQQLKFYMQLKYIFVSSFIFLSICRDAPIWPNRFSQQFVENYTYAGGVYTVGKLWYDYSNSNERVTFQNGQYQQTCGSVLPGVNTACTQLVTNGNLYIIYPEKQQCCRCCSGSYGCTVTNPKWTQALLYAGQQELSGQYFNRWTYQSQVDYYTRENDQNTPRRIHTAGYKTEDFIMNTYSEDPIDDQVFRLPAYCNKDCSRQTVCGKIEPGKIQNLKKQ